MGEDRIVYTVLVRNPEGKRPLGCPRRRFKMESQWNLRRWIEFDWHRTGNGGGLL
jgi:hypothetical protein